MSRGRPREFDPDSVLDAALEVFWRKGYEGASLPDLTGAMGINRPSLYAAFGNKEQLFRAAVDRYVGSAASQVRRALERPTARAVAKELFDATINLVTDPKNPRGCLLVQGALACSDDSEPVRLDLLARRQAHEAAIRKRFERAAAEGDLPADANPADLARFVATFQRGIAVQAAGGATHQELRRVAELALRAWPKGRRRTPAAK